MPPSIGIGAPRATAIVTPQHPERLILDTWVTSAAAFGARSAQADVLQTFTGGVTKDSDDPQNTTLEGVFKPQGGSLCVVTPVLDGADNETMNVQIWRWAEIMSGAAAFVNKKQWRRIFVAEVLCTGCLKTGVAGGIINDSQRYCDTLAFPTSQAADDASMPPLKVRFVQADTPSNTAASIALDYMGEPLITLTLRRNTAATAVNALVKTF